MAESGSLYCLLPDTHDSSHWCSAASKAHLLCVLYIYVLKKGARYSVEAYLTAWAACGWLIEHGSKRNGKQLLFQAVCHLLISCKKVADNRDYGKMVKACAFGSSES